LPALQLPQPRACLLPLSPLCSYVYIGGRLVGGCDATKALIASGEFDALLGCGTGE
jgi:hypothetical protein